MDKQKVDGIIINGVRYDVMASEDVMTCNKCDIPRNSTVCECCFYLVKAHEYFVKSEKQTEL